MPTASPDRLADPARWPSLADQLALAAHMFGGRGDRMITDWLTGDIARIDDLAFAKLFTDYISLPGIRDADYTHRQVSSGGGELIGGIRFHGKDVSRPFVEVIAHGFADLDRLKDCVATEWASFHPRDLRLRTLPGTIVRPDARVDVTIHAARHRDMVLPDGKVRLASFGNVEDAIAVVRRRYERVAASHPELARNISAADPDDLRAWHSAGQLRAIVAVGSSAGTSKPRGTPAATIAAAKAMDATVGLLAIAPGRVAWIEGDEVDEEGVEVEHNGHGYAASAQTEWAARIAADRDRFMIGTIDGLNPASRRTAERAGRPAVLAEVFIALE
ncbi:MAG: hypothetical protein ACR2RE_21910 [Geminicoccaceae bacterium]